MASGAGDPTGSAARLTAVARLPTGQSPENGGQHQHENRATTGDQALEMVRCQAMTLTATSAAARRPRSPAAMRVCAGFPRMIRSLTFSAAAAPNRQAIAPTLHTARLAVLPWKTEEATPRATVKTRPTMAWPRSTRIAAASGLFNPDSLGLTLGSCGAPAGLRSRSGRAPLQLLNPWRASSDRAPLQPLCPWRASWAQMQGAEERAAQRPCSVVSSAATMATPQMGSDRAPR